MPRLILTLPELVQREQRDIYFVRFTDGQPGEHETPAMLELTEWLKRTFPELEPVPLGFRPCDSLDTVMHHRLLWLDFNETQAARYSEAWENADGNCKDSRFQCYLLCYDDAKEWSVHALREDREHELD